MKRKVLRMLVAILVCSVAITSLTGIALAASIYGGGGDSYIRSQPNLSGAQLGLFPAGATASYLGSSAVDDRGVTWYYISYGGTTGWVSSKYTSLSGGSSYVAPSYSYASVYASGGDSYIRSSPSLSGAQLALFPEGASADYLGSDSVDSRGVTWYRVSYRGTAGWVSSKYTSFYSGDFDDTYGSTVYASGGDSYIRSSPSLSGAQLGLFPDGAAASYLGDSSTDGRGVIWYRISYRGTTGWVSSKYTYLS